MRQGTTPSSARLRRLAGPALIVLALTQTLASIDWIMSLTPHWYSTMFGVYFFAGSFVGFIALLSVVSVALRRAGLLDTVINAEHLHDVGKFLFAFTAFWAYIAFSQFFLMWYGNLPEETIWFKARMDGSWMKVSILLLAGHFVAPFFYLWGGTSSGTERPWPWAGCGSSPCTSSISTGRSCRRFIPKDSGRRCWTSPRS